MSKDQMRLLKFISQVSFALTETNLYLDTHPCDKVALSYYQMVKKQRQEAVDGPGWRHHGPGSVKGFENFYEIK